MSIYSTLNITRRTALEIFINHNFKIDNKMLEDLLDNLLEESLYNVMIVEESSKNDDDFILSKLRKHE